MTIPDLYTVALILVTALVSAVFTSVATVWLCNLDAGHREWLKGWNEHAAYEASQIIGPETEKEAIALWNAGRDVPDLVAYHTGGDTVADLRPFPYHPDE